MSLNKQVREKTWMSCYTAVDGTVTQAENLTNGASGTGSCTLSDTSLYTYTYSKTFANMPIVNAIPGTAGRRLEVAHTVNGAGRYSGCTVRGYGYGDANKTSSIIQLSVLGQ